uniref:Variant surface glycoprotein 1125.5232 n=1 Tax=Trypanosoma brucei TaxID=5691 RepID=A0A1J0RBP3_9TRYP|nr:variant surface glycoprotein 1125.5232 [Trypanosoma brucei]
MLHKLVLFAAVTTSMVFVTADPASDAVDTVSDICTEIDFLRQLQGVIENLVSAPRQRLNDLELDAEKIELAKAKTAGTTDFIKFSLLHATTQLRRGRLRAALQSQEATIANAVSKIQARIAQLQVLKRMEPEDSPTPTTVASTTKANFFGTIGTQDKCSTTYAPKATGAVKCTANPDNAAKLEALTHAFKNLKSPKLTPDSAFTRRELKIYTEMAGDATASLTPIANDKYCGTREGTKTNPTAGFAVTAVEFTNTVAKPTAQVLGSGANEDDTCQASDAATEHLLVTTKQIAAAICAVKKIDITLEETISTQTVKALIEDDDIGTLATLIAAPDTIGKADGAAKRR